MTPRTGGVPKNVTLVRRLQAANASFPILVTLLGIVTLVRPVQLANALSPILVETTVPSVAAAFDAVAKAA